MYKKEILKNGLKIIISHMPHMESVSIGIWIGIGTRYENKRLCGMSHIVEHMLFKGTTSKTANELKESIEGVGGSLNGFTGEELTCYLVKLPALYIELGLDILSDMILNPKLDPVELEKEKQVVFEEIKMYMDQPAHHVFDILAEGMWPNHALGRPIAGYIDTVKNFKKDELVDFTAQYYQPANMSIVLTGKINRAKALKLIKNTFSRTSTKKRFSYETVKENNKGHNTKVFYKKTEQTHIAFGFHSMKRTHKLRYVLTLLNIILGGNMSSRLFERLREKKALCYDISSSIKRYKETSAFIIHAGVDSNKFVDASREIIHELIDMKENFVSTDELHRAKEYAKGQFLLGLEDTISRMLWLGERIMTEKRAPSIKEVFRNIEKVKREDIKKVANMIFKKGNLNFATVGPVNTANKEKLKKALAL